MLELSIANVLGKRMFGGAGGNILNDIDWLLRLESDENVYGDYNAPELDWNPQLGSWDSDAGPTLVLTRASEATYFDSDGILQTAGVDEPRIDYNPVTLVCLGALIEPATDQYVYYTDFSQTWTPINADVTNGTFAGQASRIVTATHRGAKFEGLTLSISANDYTGSFWIRRVGAGDGIITMVHTGSPDGDVTDITAQVTNEWTQVEAQFSSDLNQLSFGVGIAETGEAVEISLPQVEPGTVATSFIPALGAVDVVPRSADICSITGTNFSDLWDLEEGTLYVEFDCSFLAGTTAHHAAMYVSDGLQISENYSALVRASDSTASANTTWQGNPGANINQVLAPGNLARCAFSYLNSGPEQSVAANGSEADAPGPPIPTGLTGIYFGGWDNLAANKNFTGHIRRVLYWNKHQANL